jgi:dipeptide transport system permease protein
MDSSIRAYATDAEGGAGPTPGPLREFWRSFAESRGALAGLVVFAVICFLALGADVLAPHEPSHQYRDSFLAPPAWAPGGSARFPLGTDAVGRDILSRIMHGARYSLAIGLIVVGLSLTVGVGLGLAAAAYRGAVEIAVMRAMDILLSLPSLLLAVVIVAILGPGLFNAMLAISVVFLPHLTRLTRAAAISELGRDYVVASRLSGASRLRVMVVVVLPNCMAPLIVQATLSFSSAILDAAALGFLGMGAQPPTPEWGTMLAEAREFVLRAWWVVTFPGLAILVTVLALNLLGDGLRDALDPKLKRE